MALTTAQRLTLLETENAGRKAEIAELRTLVVAGVEKIIAALGGPVVTPGPVLTASAYMTALLQLPSRDKLVESLGILRGAHQNDIAVWNATTGQWEPRTPTQVRSLP